MQDLGAIAPTSAQTTDPDICPALGDPDPAETSIGGLSSRLVLKFSSPPNLTNLYARLAIETQVCTVGSSLSSQDEKAFEKVLNFLKVTDARSFVATVSLIGDGQGGVTYPSIVPFSYSFDESSKKYSVATVGQGFIPWQVTNAFEVHYSYSANQTLSINTTSLFSSIATAAAGTGVGTALLSKDAASYLAVGQTILTDLAQLFTATNTADDRFTLELLQAQDRRLYYRFRDLSNPPRPLAALRLTVVFTNSIAKPDPVDPLAADSAHVPQFSDLQNILSVAIGGPSGGQTLLQAISKEPSYQSILKANSDTDAQSFRGFCDDLEGKLRTTYGLNDFDNALTMGQILSQENTLYLNSKKFYNSGCFQHRSLLKTMGIAAFETAPSS